jgi:hypothetical protein
MRSDKAQLVRASVLKRVLAWLKGDRGNVTPIMALMMVPIVGAVGLALETSNWFNTHRSMQHAADSAALAAAISHVATADADFNEAKAVAGNFGYVDGSGNVTVGVERNITCPAPNAAFTDCYRVTIAKTLAISLTRMVGYNGDVAMGSGRGKVISSVAIARPRGSVDDLCFIGLSTTGDSLRINGGPKMDWGGCSVYGNSDLTCNGTNADFGMLSGVAAGSSGCGHPAVSHGPVLADPYLWVDGYIPPNTCPSYPPADITTSSISATDLTKCGTQTLQTDVTFTSPNTVLKIYGGNLNLNGHTLSTGPGASLTIIFSGPNTSTGSTITGSGSVNYAAPDTGPLHGLAWIQDKDSVSNSMTFTGNNPNFFITGLVYMPKTDVTISGTIHFQVGGNHCFGMVANSFRVNGAEKITDGANTQCAEAGVGLPTVPGTNSRAALLQ